MAPVQPAFQDLVHLVGGLNLRNLILDHELASLHLGELEGICRRMESCVFNFALKVGMTAFEFGQM
ncbi:hypothetical protein A3843_10700 [Pseudovibrio exalbescens]|uniref:Uncharacterized protein n=1 Tax=Pseudovibrio exalbescens TaxID=197461 RepID=A0A1U7JH82_9HYPH|nr:hypothetical protein A3843_10700 [Pseudovibrio exalbescens]